MLENELAKPKCYVIASKLRSALAFARSRNEQLVYINHLAQLYGLTNINLYLLEDFWLTSVWKDLAGANKFRYIKNNLKLFEIKENEIKELYLTEIY